MARMTRCLFLELGLVPIVLAGLAPAAVAKPRPKVEICHIPPGNPDAFHTITVGARALPAHLAHGDLGGACESVCATICDDGDACTIDDDGSCDSEGCPTYRDLVDCDDDNPCTDDFCDSETGCSNDPVVCEPPDLCTVSQCAPDTGECVDSPIVCPVGFSCNPDTGACDENPGPDPECAGQTCRAFSTCNEGGSCGALGVCATTSEGGGLCIHGLTECADLTECFGGAGDCAIGEICVVDTCCLDPVCVPNTQFCSEPPAGFTPSFEQLETQSSPSGPTISSP